MKSFYPKRCLFCNCNGNSNLKDSLNAYVFNKNKIRDLRIQNNLSSSAKIQDKCF